MTESPYESYRKAHVRPDTDQERHSIHHTLGIGPNQAAKGNHDHSGVYQPAYTLHKGRLSRAAAQSIANVTTTTIDWSAETYDSDSIVDLANDRFEVQRDGTYSIKCGVQWAANLVGRRLILILVNGVEVQRSATTPADNSIWGHSVVYENNLVDGDLVTFQVRQESGGNLDVTGWASIHEVR